MSTNHIRNFVIISHIDHGKSTLADRFLELTAAVAQREMRAQYLDSMELERERGITIKMAPVKMHYAHSGASYELNLIDTPGHVDFSYEVSRALAAVEGAILLVDASKGIQAQTLAHFREAVRQNLTIIPVINKIDLPGAHIESVETAIRTLLPESEIFKISAKEGTGVRELLQAVIERVPPPRERKGSLASRALIFDSHYDPYKGVLAYVRVAEGSFKVGVPVAFLAQKRITPLLEVGSFMPQKKAEQELLEGTIGYLATGLKDPALVRVGDTIVGDEALAAKDLSVLSRYAPLMGYEEPRPVVFASVFPSEGADIALLTDAFTKLKLSDWALTFEPESSEILGRGFRCGFLGSLHLEIVLERLRREFNLSFIATTPSVRYEALTLRGEKKVLYSPAEWPGAAVLGEVAEPWVRLTIFVPSSYLGPVLQLLQARRGKSHGTTYLSEELVEVAYDIPLSEIIVDFYDKLKSVSQGYASLAYEHLGMRPGELAKLTILVAGEPVEAFGKIVPKEKVLEAAKSTIARLKALLPRQLFEVRLQASVEGRIIARENIAALKKDVTGYLYGGDITRKKKLWEKQKKGKKRMLARGKVDIPSRVFVEMLKSSSSQ